MNADIENKFEILFQQVETYSKNLKAVNTYLNILFEQGNMLNEQLTNKSVREAYQEYQESLPQLKEYSDKFFIYMKSSKNVTTKVKKLLDEMDYLMGKIDNFNQKLSHASDHVSKITKILENDTNDIIGQKATERILSIEEKVDKLTKDIELMSQSLNSMQEQSKRKIQYRHFQHRISSR